MSTQKWIAGAITYATISGFDTALNSLANDAGLASSALNNGTNLDMYADVVFNIAGHGTAPTADKTHDLYIVRSLDGGSIYEDYSATRPPAYGSVGSFVLDNTSGAQVHVIPGILLPPGYFKFYIVNKSGYALTASGHTIKWITYNQQVV